MIDRESERAVSGWVQLGDQVLGREPETGRCDECGRGGTISREGPRKLCARCYLEGRASTAA